MLLKGYNNVHLSLLTRRSSCHPVNARLLTAGTGNKEQGTGNKNMLVIVAVFVVVVLVLVVVVVKARKPHAQRAWLSP